MFGYRPKNVAATPRRRAWLPVFFAHILFVGSLCFGQGDSPDLNGQTVPQLPEPALRAESEGADFTFKVVTRLAVLELIVTDADDNPVRDLTVEQLRVSERVEQSEELPQKISDFRSVNKAVERTSPQTEGMVLSAPHRASFCGSDGTYEISYYLSSAARRNGLHRIFVKSSRNNLKLFYRQGYRIEDEKSVQASPVEIGDKGTASQLRKEENAHSEAKKHPELELSVIACYDDLVKTSFLLEAKKVKASTAKYDYIVPASYFAPIAPSETSRNIDFDFAICTFDYRGVPFRHFQGKAKAVLTREKLLGVAANGLRGQIGFDAQSATTARLVLRDTVTGALGSAELQLVPFPGEGWHIPIEGNPTTSFGGTTAVEGGLCGDVYLLEPGTFSLPRYPSMEPIAPIYATSLAVYSRFFTAGVAGITDRTEWFGINYQGMFGVDEPGKYQFEVMSDDGARVFVDDKLVADNDGPGQAQSARGSIRLETGAHRIRLAYFQGRRTEVALVLLVKPPEIKWRLFDTRDFPVRENSGPARKKLNAQH